MSSLWTLIKDANNVLPVLKRSGTNVGSGFNSNALKLNLYGSGNPTDPIDVLNYFQWTKSPRSSRQDVPKMRLIEKRILTNSTVTNLAYSLLAGTDLLQNTGIANQVSSIVNSGLQSAENNQTLVEGLEQIGSQIGKIGNDTGIADKLSETYSKIKGDLNGLQVDSFQDNVLKPYNFLYNTERTGFEYIFPYLESSYRDFTTQMGRNQGNLVAGVTDFLGNLVSEAAGALLFSKPGVYIEEAKQFSMGQQGRTINLKLPLLNTGSYQDILMNWQLIYGLIYQNRPGRVTRNIVDVPVIYELFIEGVAYMPYAYISNLSVNFLGNRRTMELTIPVQDSAENGSDIGNQVKNIRTAIPDAYELNFSITGLNDETRNFMYQSVQGASTLVKTAIKLPEVENVSPSNAGSVNANAFITDNNAKTPFEAASERIFNNEKPKNPFSL